MSQRQDQTVQHNKAQLKAFGFFLCKKKWIWINNKE
jgi:hypothetical protein